MMGKGQLELSDEIRIGFLSFPNLSNQWNTNSWDGFCPPVGGLFASIGQVNGVGFGNNGVSPNPRDKNNGNEFKLPYADLYAKYISSPEALRISDTDAEEVLVEEGVEVGKTKKKTGLKKLKLKVKNPSLRRLISGAIAGAVSRTAVAPLETIRTHLMVATPGSSSTSTDVFNDIMKTDGWKGLFRGNFVNVIRVAPSKAVELLAYDTVNKFLSPKPGEQAKQPIPASLIAGACAGVTSTVLTYPLELLKTRITIQGDAYNGLLDAFVKIIKEGGPGELYRGLAPSVIGVIPYAATNYYAYDTLRKAYRKILKQEKIGNIETLLIGSLAGAISSTATFPLEVARKHMQVGALNGRQVYSNVIHALVSIFEQEGVGGLYRGLGPSCVKLVPAAGISFMCYEACKRILVENEAEE